jgi:crotonobetainyl-CoA:carnitine CoA-transferase CaiB-like acyl-CoA transferase
MAAFYIAAVSVNAAIRARGITGRGQHINTSLLHGVLATTIAAWQKVERPDAAGFQSWVVDPRAPKGFFRGSDGRWVHHWVPLPEFIVNAAANGMQPEGLVGPRKAKMRVGSKVEDMVILHAYQQDMAEAVARYPSQQWTELASRVGVPVQTVRSPEEALLDPLLLADGCVVEVDDPEAGPIRQVGRVVELSRHPNTKPHPAPLRGQHSEVVRAEADALRASPVAMRGATDEPVSPEPVPPEPVSRAAVSPQPVSRAPVSPRLSSPLEGVVVLDLGLAVAGPFGTQVLAQLGARVIKVNNAHEEIWFRNHIAMTCNRDKESIILDLKDPEGMSVLHRLVERADVVQHNMRYDAAERLGVDYESLRQLNPRLIYCHTLGHEQGPRQYHPGNDQTGAALAGTEWLDGGLDNGGRPIWSCTSLGDTGNGFLSALGIIQALYDRDRSGEGQFVRTSILYAQLLNASTTWISPDGATQARRQRPDAEQYGWNALYRLYRATDGWLCLAAYTENSWADLCRALGRRDLETDPLYATAQARRSNDSALATELASIFAGRSITTWFDLLDSHGVPCEVSDPDFALRLFSDPDAETAGLVSRFHHPVMGEMKMAGLCFDLSETPGVIGRPPLWPGQDTRRILGELGYTADEVDKLVAGGAAVDTSAGG